MIDKDKINKWLARCEKRVYDIIEDTGNGQVIIYVKDSVITGLKTNKDERFNNCE